MNEWMRDPRVAQAETDAFQAERAERRGNPSQARALYRQAAESLACVALRVPADHPNTRGDLAIAAVASFSRAGDFGRAIEFGQRMLAEGDALTAHGRDEIRRLVHEYELIAAPGDVPVLPMNNRGRAVRDQVRGMFRRAA
jgi:hypothetical protein